MITAWLKAWGHHDSPCTGWREDSRDRVTFDENHNGAGISKGDMLVLYAVNREDQIFAIAEVMAKAVRENPPKEPKKPFVARVRPIAVCPVENAPSVIPIFAPQKFDARSMQASYKRLTPDQFARTKAALKATPECIWYE